MSVPSLEKIYNDYYGKVMGYIMARVRRRAEAEDIASDVFEKIVRKIDDFDETKASVSTWVFTITRNTLIDHYRRTKPSEELDENLAEDGELDEDLLRSETLGELADALRSMPVTTALGGTVALSSVANVEIIQAPQSISRDNAHYPVKPIISHMPEPPS